MGKMGKMHETVRMKVSEVVKQCLLKAIDSLIKQTSSTLVKWRLEQLKRLTESLEVYDVILRHELGVKKGFIDIDVLGRIIFELKSKTSEFREAEEKIKNVYAPQHKKARWAIITNFEIWNFYKIKNGDLILEKQSINEKDTKEILLSIFLRELSEDIKIAPSQSTIAALFKDISKYEEDLLEIFKKYKENEIVKPLFEAYRSIIATLYGKADENLYESLYIKHTLLQMIVASCLTVALSKSCTPQEACNGSAIPIEITLPYLNWWHLLFDKVNEEEKKVINDLTKEIYTKSLMLDWETGSIEDAFRELYELLIDRETRRKIGEYYTPLWLVDLLIERVYNYIDNLSNLLVVDPFCGSGTFLVRIFHTKVEEGMKPEEAIKEVVGFDINPLAVSIARAELMLAYRKYNTGIATPMVFHSDTLAVICNVGTELYPIEEVKKLKELIDNLISETILSTNRISPSDLTDLLRIEIILRGILEEVYNASKESEEKAKTIIYNRLKKLDHYSWNTLGQAFVSSLTNNLDTWSKIIYNLVKKYGNGVWSATISSFIAPMILSRIGADIVITNPPWQRITEIGNLLLKKKIIEINRKILLSIGIPKNKVHHIIAGSDLASIALYGGLKWAKKVVAYVMPRECSFCAKVNQRAGIVTTYAVTKMYASDGEIIDVNYDAFQHGNYPALVIIKKGGVRHI